MSGRRARPGEDQLVFDLGAREHPAVEHARAVRAKAGLSPSLSSPDVLNQVCRILDPDRSARPHVRRAS